MKTYEILSCIDTDNPTTNDTIIKKLIDIIIRNGGQMLNHTPWGVKRLPFEICGKTESYYNTIRFTATPKTIKELDSTMTADKMVLRHIIIRQDK